MCVIHLWPSTHRDIGCMCQLWISYTRTRQSLSCRGSCDSDGTLHCAPQGRTHELEPTALQRGHVHILPFALTMTHQSPPETQRHWREMARYLTRLTPVPWSQRWLLPCAEDMLACKGWAEFEIMDLRRGTMTLGCSPTHRQPPTTHNPKLHQGFTSWRVACAGRK